MPTPAQRPLHPWLRAFILIAFFPTVFHLALWQWPALKHDESWFGRVFYWYALVEHLALRFPKLSAALVLGALLGGRRLYQKWILYKSDKFTRRVTGLNDELADLTFPQHDYDVLPFLLAERHGLTFVGLTPTRRRLPPWGTAFKPVYLSELLAHLQ